MAIETHATTALLAVYFSSFRSIFDVKPEVSKHLPVDISSFLVEEKKPVSVVDVNTQTNEFHDRPPTPEYVPKKTGVDASTQIEPGS